MQPLPARDDVAGAGRVHPYATDETYAAMLWFVCEWSAWVRT